MRDEQFRPTDAAVYLHVAPQKAKAIISELVKRGWLDVVPQKELPQWHRSKRAVFYELSIAGNGFAIARALRRIDRTNAEERLNAFIRRVQVVNENDEFCWYVDEVRVFGSYLDTSTADLGDIDISVALKKRPIIGRSIVEHGRQRARAAGKTIRGHFELLTYPEREVRRFLKNCDPYISIHDPFDLEELKPRSKLIYRAPLKDSVPRAARPPPPER